MEEVEIKSGPKCAGCGIVGIEYISSEDSTEQNGAGDAWFNIAYSNQCGHIHGIFNKVVNTPSSKLPTFNP